MAATVLVRCYCLLLNHDRAIPDAATDNDVADAKLDDIATAQLAVDSEVDERSIRRSPVVVQPEANSPDLLG